LFVAMTVFAACRAPRLLPVALGLLFSSKQYAIFVAPLAYMLLAKPTWKSYGALILKAAAVAAVITLPWALWNVRAFVESVVVFQSRQPFRQDALSYLVWSAVEGLPRLPLSACFVMLVPAFALALWRAPRTPAGFAAATAIVFLVFFSFAKQAFCNYYMMIVGALCCAAAAAKVGLGPAHAQS
jgi:hypothetical protein